MSKEYVFEFFGTKEEFVSKIDPNKSCINSSIAKTYYIDDYIISISENEIFIWYTKSRTFRRLLVYSHNHRIGGPNSVEGQNKIYRS